MQRNSLFLSLLLFATLLSLLAAPLRAQDDPELAQPRRVATGFVFTEGPRSRRTAASTSATCGRPRSTACVQTAK
jgi:hypothetical protein